MSTARVWLALGALVFGVLVDLGPMLFLVGCLGAAALGLRRRREVALAGFTTLCLGLGSMAGSAREHVSALERLARAAPTCRVQGRFLESAGRMGTLAAIDAAYCSGYEVVRDAGTVVFDGTAGEPGAVFRGEGRLLPLGDGSFDDARARVGADALFDPTLLGVVRSPSGLHGLASAVRRGLESEVLLLPVDRAAVVEGLTIGDTSGFDTRTIESFRRSGLAHLLAVSGSNVAVVLAAAAAAARPFGLLGRVVVGAAALALYVLVVGPDPSVLRASAMGVIALLAVVGGRRSDPLHALGLALIAVVAFRPAMVFSVGLHLSAAATAGIVLWTRSLAARFGSFPRPVALGLAATLAAQAAVAPILVATFGELSLIAPVANLIVIPAVPVITVLGLGAGAAGAVAGGLGAGPLRLADPLAHWILGVARGLGGLSWASVEVPRWWGFFLGVPVLAAAVWSVRAADRVDGMGDWHWLPYDIDDHPMEPTQSFSTREEAESWMGAEWSGLLDEGAESVRLIGDGKEYYKMGLREA